MACTCKYLAPGMKSEICQECINSQLAPGSLGVFYPQDIVIGVEKSARFNEGKIQTREIDPNFILGIGEVLTKSRAKYEHFNWAKKTNFSVPYESLMRHLMAFQNGEDFDSETQSHHLLHAATNIMFLYYHAINNSEESDDRFFKKKK